MAVSSGITSFRKSRMKSNEIPGTKPSLYNNQLLISTGIPSLDLVIGGGIAVGTVMLVEEDLFATYANLVVNYFVSEGIVCEQSVLAASLDLDMKQLTQELPAPISDEPQLTTSQPDSDSMKIAWRYEAQPKVQSSAANTRFGHYYDLTKTMDGSQVESADITTIGEEELDTQAPRQNQLMKSKYCELLRHIKLKLDTGQFSTACKSDKRNILRIVLRSLGSPLWGECGVASPQDQYDPSLLKFLLVLRSLLRSAYATCLITMPSHLFQDPAFIERVEKMCDTVIQLESFAGSDREKNPAFKEYSGLLHIRQLPRLNSLVSHMPDTLDLAYKLRRKKFTVEKLHLPPELSESASRSQEDVFIQNKSSNRSSCSSSGTSKFDF
ncbi:elongator complex protein 4-like [Gigantopelta aegis]|uniref:elongator complex protein 4-like n=1 Tax=Gigantopelta aegis TaxID=1735272 RepID=UPI001B88C89D|nr:elongator complex protein 4-like [Gigantopelta aegis]